MRRFASGEAPEQTASKASAPAAEKAAPATALGEDEIQRFLEELSTLTKVRCLRHGRRQGGRQPSQPHCLLTWLPALQDLKGRSVGRNADDVATLHAGVRLGDPRLRLGPAWLTPDTAAAPQRHLGCGAHLRRARRGGEGTG